MKVADDSGRMLDAEVSLDVDGDCYRIVFESRGPERNTDYIPAFAAIVRRLARQSVLITDATVVSKNVSGLSINQRRMALEGRPFPLSLSEREDTEALAVALRSAAARVGRPQDSSGGGNPTKRVEMLFQLPGKKDASLGWIEQQIISPNAAMEVAAIERLTRPRRTSSGQGRGLDAAARKAVELRAMDVARESLERDWHEVKDVSATRSYDFHCKHDSEEILVEVKGSTGGGDSIVLTANEVKLARENYPRVVLCVVTEIELGSVPEGVVASGGLLTIYRPLDLSSHRLEPIAYQCFLSASEKATN